MKITWKSNRLKLVSVGLLVALLVVFNPFTVSAELPSKVSSITIGHGQKNLTLGNRAYAAGTIDYSVDGIADDVQFAQAIGVLQSVGGGEIVALSGNYSFSAAVSVPSNITIKGVGSSTRITMSVNTTDTFVTTGSNITISNLSIIGFSLMDNAYGVDIASGSQNVTVNNVWISNFGSGVLIDNAQFNMVSNSYFGEIGATDGSAPGYGVIVLGNGNKIVNNTFTGVHRHAIYLSGSAGYSATNNIVSANYITGGTTHEMIAVYATVAQKPVTGNSIIGNTLVSVYDGINVTENAVNTSIVQNTFKSVTRYPIQVEGNINYADKPRLGLINGNTFEDITGGSGIIIYMHNADDWIISNNIADNVTTNFHGIVISTDGASIGSYSDRNMILFNKVSHIANNAIRLGTANVRYTMVIGNELSNTNFTSLTNSGTNSLIRDNTGYVTENTGTFSITAGLWGVAVSHGLSTNATSVQLTLTSNATAAIYVQPIVTTTQFTANLSALQGTAITGYWRAVVGSGN